MGPSRSFEASLETIPVTVASGEPRWPRYPGGPIAPEEIQELYGRGALLQLIARNLGPRRAASTFLFEGPRQMGKTSILRFAESRAPTHVLAVYVNLERPWGSPPSLWSYLAREICKKVSLLGGSDLPCFEEVETAEQLASIAQATCAAIQREYVLLLLDEFHHVIERSPDPGSTLAELRAFHDSPSYRISMILADRFTKEELEKAQPHDIWAQITIKSVGPLDVRAVAQALRSPNVGIEQSDVYFPDETIRRLHEETSGYPYHVVRAAQGIVDQLWGTGPWLVALPRDVDDEVQRMEEVDELFQAGLCQPDRIDLVLHQAIAALLDS